MGKFSETYPGNINNVIMAYVVPSPESTNYLLPKNFTSIGGVFWTHLYVPFEMMPIQTACPPSEEILKPPLIIFITVLINHVTALGWVDGSYDGAMIAEEQLLLRAQMAGPPVLLGIVAVPSQDQSSSHALNP